MFVKPCAMEQNPKERKTGNFDGEFSSIEALFHTLKASESFATVTKKNVSMYFIFYSYGRWTPGWCRRPYLVTDLFGANAISFVRFMMIYLSE